MAADLPNLFDNLPLAPELAERFDDLLRAPGVRIERIVSTGQAGAPGSWQCQSWDEWIMLVEGGARLIFEGGEERVLARGDHLLIPAGQRHRVSFTDPACSTIWLAVHLGEPEGSIG